MHTEHTAVPPQPTGPASDTPPHEAPEESSFFGDLVGMLSDRVHLFSLELQQAARALAQMVALTMLAVAFGATAWVALWVWLAAALLDAGLAAIWVMLIVAGLNVAAAGLAVHRALARARLIGLPATVRRLTRAHRPAQPDDASHAAHAASQTAAHAHAHTAAHAAPEAAPPKTTHPAPTHVH